MPLPTPAEMRDRTKTNAQMREMMAQIVEKVSVQQVELPYNIFNKSNISKGVIVRETGEIESTDADWVLSGFIRVERGEVYICYSANNNTGYSYVSFYNKEKQFRSRAASSAFGMADNAKIITIAAGVEYIRISYRASSVDTNSLMLVKGGERMPYISGEIVIDNVIFRDGAEDDIRRIASEIKNVADDYITKYNNLFDYRKATEGYLVSAEGEVVESSTGYSVSDFIPVEPNAKYTISGQVGVGINAFTSTALYDSGMQFLRRISTSNASAPNGRLTITIPSDTHYVRLNTNNGKPFERSRMFNKGSEALPYDTGGAELSNLRLSGDIINQIKGELDHEGGGGNNNRYLIDMNVNTPFSTDVSWNQYSLWRRGKTSEEVYQMFDDLLNNNTDYMSKQFLANDLAGNRIELYKLRQPLARVGGYNRKKPKIFMAVALHGYEQLSPLAVYLMCQQLCENWQSDPVLEAIRYNAELYIIPIVVPYGWNNFQRTNANGVDINRNFPRGHGTQSTDPDSVYYGGEYPFSEIESNCIKQVIDEKPEIDVYMDCHNFAGVPGRRDYVWIANENAGICEHLVQLLGARLDRQWRREFEWYSEFGSRNPVYSTTGTAGNGTSKAYAYDRGIKIPVTFEVCEKWWVQGDDLDNRYDATHCKTAVETYVNWLSIVINYLTK